MLKKLLFLGLILLFSLLPSATLAGEFDQWVAEKVNLAISKIDQVTTNDRAVWWAQTFVVPIPSEYFGPTSVGSLKLAASGLTMERAYAGEDLHEILDSVKQLILTLDQLNGSIGVPDYGYYHEWLTDMAESLRQKIMPDRP